MTKKNLSELADRHLLAISAGVILFVFILTVPALLVPLGLPAEGDALTYRIPLIKWILRHSSLPVWDWTFVDDYPSLGELLMVPLYWIHPSMARIVPISAYFGVAFFSAGILREILRGRKSFEENSRFWIFAGMAWVLGLRPLALQSNLLMVDNIAASFALGSIFFMLKARLRVSAGFLALALATRYSIWGASVGIFAGTAWLAHRQKKLSLRELVLFVAISSLGALPFMVRNALVNEGNPIFPLLDKNFRNVYYDFYGRGKDLISLLLLPVDLVYTNSFVRGLYDYTLGKLFLVQLAACGIACLFRPKLVLATAHKAVADPKIQSVAIAWTAMGIFWFYGSQQMRFLVSNLALVNVAMLFICYRALPRPALAALLLLTCYSLFSIQKDPLLIAFGRKPILHADRIEGIRQCMKLIPENEPVGFRETAVLGYLDHDFVFLDAYGIPRPEGRLPKYEFMFVDDPRQPVANFSPWPPESPCILKRNG